MFCISKKAFYLYIIICLFILSGCFNKEKESVVEEKINIDLLENNINMYIGDEYTIDTTNYPGVSFRGEDESIAVVNSLGIITAKGKGTTHITLEGERYLPSLLNVNVYSKLEKIIFDEKKIILEKGSSKEINYTIYPEDAKIDTIDWSLSNDNVSIENNVLKAIKTGSTRVKLVINDIEEYFDVEVIVKPINIKFKEKNISLLVDETKKLNVTFEPSDTTEKDLTYKVGNKDIINVDTKGRITALKKGNTYIEVTTSNNLKAKIDVEVKPVVPTSVKFEKSTLDLYKGNKYKLSTKVYPTNSENKEVKYTSSNTDIVLIDSNNNIIGQKAGKAIITAETFNNKKTTMTVYVRNNTYNKKAIFFGDSITEGKDNSWVEYIGSHYDLKSTKNAGKSGWFISNSFDKDWIVNNVKKYADKKYDYVIISGGVNDINHSASMGMLVPDDFSGNYNSKTFIGGLETYIYTVKKQWPNAKIGYIITYYAPLRSKNLKENSRMYVNEMKKVLNKWNIKYIDLFDGKSSNGTYYKDILKVDTYTYMPDGLHINDEGYNLISPEIYAWMNRL